MSNNKQTAVEYLVEQLLPKALSAEQYYHIEQAKEMEKQQIVESFKHGEMPKLFSNLSAEQYYNEEYGGNK